MIERIFFDHPRQVGQSYLEHQRFAARIGGLLLLAGSAALIHAIVPSLFVTTAGDAIERLHAVMKSRPGPASAPNGVTS